MSTPQPGTITTEPAEAPPLDLPDMIAPRSSNIHGIGFRNGTLYLKFQAGKVYSYTGEGIAQHADAILKADSAGSYFAKHLRNNAGIQCRYLGQVTEAVLSVRPGCCKCGAAITAGMVYCPLCAPAAADDRTRDGVQ